MKKHIKTLAQGCKVTGDNPKDVKVTLNGKTKRYEKNLQAFLELMIMTDAENEGKEPDYTNTSEPKYEPWLIVEGSKKKPSGSGLRFSACAYGYTSACVRARLNFRTSESATNSGKDKAWLKKYADLFGYHKLPVEKKKAAPAKKAVAKKTASVKRKAVMK